MKKVFSFFTILWCSSIWACELKQDTVSLSAPVTGVIEFLGLLESPRLKAISLFHPVQASKLEKLSGGLFLSQKTIERFKTHVIYFDESRELKERLAVAGLKVEVRTRSLTPFAATRRALSLLAPNLYGCEKKSALLEDWLKSEETWQKAQPALGKIYFFLGAISSERWPEYLMVRDGFVLSLLEWKKLTTFESELAYVRWGEKWKKSLGSERLVGLMEAEKSRVEKISEVKSNFYFPGALTPGIHQIRFMRFLRENLP